MWPLYAGGFLGPFGGAMTNTMLPELGHGLGTDVAGASAAVTAYMIPFAGLMIVSGTVAAAWGAARTVRRAYVLYAIASLVCIVATSLGPFLLGRAVQGAANAFTTPILIAMIAAIVPPGRRGRALGTYASLQAAGQAFAPFVGGLAAGVDYRWAFGVTAAAALFLAVVTPSPRSEAAAAPKGGRWRPLANLALGQAATVALCAQFASNGLMLLAAVLASDRFGLEPGARGAVVAAFGVAGLLAGRSAGRLADAIGARRMGLLMLVVLGGAVAAAGVSPAVAALVGCVALAGVAGTGARVLTNTLALASTPANPSGATSLMLSGQFLGAALAPLLLPLYAGAPEASFVVAGAVALIGAALVLARAAPVERR